MNTRGAITATPAGYDANGRKVTLFSQVQADGTVCYSIRIEPRTFKETPQLVEGLTSDNLLAMAAAVSGGAK